MHYIGTCSFGPGFFVQEASCFIDEHEEEAPADDPACRCEDRGLSSM